MEGTRYSFPRTFFWGTAASAYQTEGGNVNDWSAWERSRGRIAELKRQGKDPAAFVCGKAADFWHRYEEDLDNAHLLGHTMFRMSLEWSRIEPREGEFDDEALAHYRKIVQAVRARGMEPMVTLWHFTNPRWFAAKGGFLSSDATRLFTRYAVRAARALQDDVRYWVTFNEATTVYAARSYLTGIFPAGERSVREALRHRRGVANAHDAAYRELKSVLRRPSSIGVVEGNKAPVSGRLARWAGLDRWYERAVNHWLWRRTRNDFLGLNYYTLRRLPGSYGAVARQSVDEAKGWELWPEGIYHALKAAARMRLPIFVTENGIADARDARRAAFIRDHLAWLARAMREGVDVRGYLYWSLTDNFEWEDGFAPRFGLVSVDYGTQKRTIRPSAYVYAKLIREHAVDLPGSGGTSARRRGRRHR